MTKIKFVEAGSKIPHSKIYHYDVIILGGGPAGLTAAIYTSRYGMKTILISKDIGGTANYASEIENYPGYRGSGKKLMNNFYKHAKKFGAEILNDDIISIEKDDNGAMVAISTHKIIHSKSIILALGSQRKKLNIPGEDKFLGKGVSYCATCDGYFFKNKAVAVIGAGDSACKSALLLSGIAKKVYLVHRSQMEKCENILVKRMKTKGNIEALANSSPMEIRGKEKVTDLIIWKDNGEIKLDVDGVFIEIGGLPVSDIARLLGVDLDKEGHVIVDSDMKTNIPGIFAAGDIVKSKLKQIIVAASQGAIAARSANDFVSGK